jgi:hypothetical protein
MKLSLITLLSASLLALATGCGKSSASSDKASGGDQATASNAVSCNMPDMGVCSEDPASEELGASMACSMFKGTFAKSACPADKRIGVCTEKKEANKEPGKKVYYLGNLSAPFVADAKKDCEENVLSPGGTFAAVAGVDDAAKAAAMPQPAQITGSCAINADKCDDYLGKGLTDDEHQNTCKELSGKWSTTPCGATKLVGTCRGSGVASRYYAGGPSSWKSADAQKDCEIMSGNHFFPAAGAAPATAPAAAPKKKTASR